MKKWPIFVFLTILLAGALFVYYNFYGEDYSKQYNKQLVHYDSKKAEEVAVYFDYAKEKLPEIIEEIESIQKKDPVDSQKLKTLQEQVKTYKIVNLIANQDIEALKKLSPEELEDDGQIWVEGTRFKDTMDGKLASAIIGGRNALAYVLFHSALDQTEEDIKKTLAMLKILLGKNLTKHLKAAGAVYWVKEKPTDEQSFDYIVFYSLPELALTYSYPAAFELLLKNKEPFNSEAINSMIQHMKKNNIKTAEEFEKAFSKYKN